MVKGSCLRNWNITKNLSMEEDGEFIKKEILKKKFINNLKIGK